MKEKSEQIVIIKTFCLFVYILKSLKKLNTFSGVSDHFPLLIVLASGLHSTNFLLLHYHSQKRLNK